MKLVLNEKVPNAYFKGIYDLLLKPESSYASTARITESLVAVVQWLRKVVAAHLGRTEDELFPEDDIYAESSNLKLVTG